MTNGINQPNPYLPEEEQNMCLLEPEVLQSVDDSVIDVEPEPVEVAETLPPEEIPTETDPSSYATAPERTLQSIAPNTPRTPHAVKIYQASRREKNGEGKTVTVQTAHVGVEDWSAMESRPVYDAVVQRRGRGSNGTIVAVGIVNHETGESNAMSREEVRRIQARREVNVGDLFVSAESVPSPVMVVRAMVEGPAAVRRLETPEEQIERSSAAVVAGCCALCGECVEGDDGQNPAAPDLTASAPVENAAGEVASGATADASTPPADALTPTTASSAPSTSPSEVAPAQPGTQTEQARQAQENPVPPADNPARPLRSDTTNFRSDSSSWVDDSSGDGLSESGRGYAGTAAPEFGAAYAAGAIAGSPGPALVFGRTSSRSSAKGSRAATIPAHAAASAFSGFASSIVSRRSGASSPGLVGQDGASSVDSPPLFPQVGHETTVAAVQDWSRGGLVSEFPLPGDIVGQRTPVLEMSLAGEIPVTRTARRASNESDGASPDFLAAVAAINAQKADAREFDPYEAASSIVSPAAFLAAHQASRAGTQSVHVDSREQDGVVARQDAELNTVSDPTQMGTQTGGQDARQGTSDPTIVAANEVEGDEVLEGELVDDFDDISRWNPLGNAQVAADIIV